jgi:hypothetical protein
MHFFHPSLRAVDVFDELSSLCFEQQDPATQGILLAHRDKYQRRGETGACVPSRRKEQGAVLDWRPTPYDLGEANEVRRRGIMQRVSRAQLNVAHYYASKRTPNFAGVPSFGLLTSHHANLLNARV